ncbi:unnamed protein product [Timema podura]|uniref:Uncharacterized protein n=1 Tax=Timema podura TaxID=61482 RepID=A0ABN7PA51_TIMPD|nr:unnamed protein product [Timema podura]
MSNRFLTEGHRRSWGVGPGGKHEVYNTRFMAARSKRHSCDKHIHPSIMLVSEDLRQHLCSLFPQFELVGPTERVQVKKGFGNQINPCRDRGLNPGPTAQKSDTLPLDHQLTYW